MNSQHLLYAQVILLVLLFYFGSLSQIFTSGILTIIFTIGIILALWSFYNMGTKTYSPFAEPRKGGKLAVEGAYKYIRHPMYTGIALLAFAFFLTSFNFPTFLIFAVLLYVLDQKATLEENLLAKAYPAYKQYIDKTKKFIPFWY